MKSRSIIQSRTTFIDFRTANLYCRSITIQSYIHAQYFDKEPELWLLILSHRNWNTWCLDFSEVPAGVNHDDELVPQGGVAYSQVDLPKWTLMFPDGSRVMGTFVNVKTRAQIDSVRGSRLEFTTPMAQNITIDSLWKRGPLCKVETWRSDGVVRQQAVGVKATHVRGWRWPPGFRRLEGAATVTRLVVMQAILETSCLGCRWEGDSGGGVGGKFWRGGCSGGGSGSRSVNSLVGLRSSLSDLWRRTEDNLGRRLFQRKDLFWDWRHGKSQNGQNNRAHLQVLIISFLVEYIQLL